MARLFSLHSRGLAASHADLENHALAQDRAFAGTPGSVLERSNASGFRFYALQQYGPDGRKHESYLAGPIGDPAAEDAAGAARRAIAEQRDVVASARLLIREGYAALPPKHFAAVAALANHRFFAGGGVLVGTHAFDVIANKLGIRAPAFATTDVDLGRAGKIAIDAPEGGLLEMLRSSGVAFDPVPGFDPRTPSVKIKERGHSRFTVDLLVPAPGTEISTQYVPELKAHATAMPYMRYLVVEAQTAAVISRNGCAAVRVPIAERFAVHKLLVGRLRRAEGERSRKDVRQACVLVAALAELAPGAIAEAFAKLPSSAKRPALESLQAGLPQLVDHPAALEEANALVGGRRGAARQ